MSTRHSRAAAALASALFSLTGATAPLAQSDPAPMPDAPAVAALADADTSILGTNPATKPYDGPYSGVPAFDEVKVGDLEQGPV